MPTVPGPRSFGPGVIADADGVDVAEAVGLHRAEDGEVEEMHLPVDEIDHLRQVHHRLGDGDVLGIRAGRTMPSVGLVMPPGPDTHHRCGAWRWRARLQAATWMSELVPTIAFSPSAMSRASSTASISPMAN